MSKQEGSCYATWTNTNEGFGGEANIVIDTPGYVFGNMQRKDETRKEERLEA